MYITSFGHSCFKFQDKTGSDAVTLITDPFDKTVGLKLPSGEADIVTISHKHDDHNNLEAIKGKPFVIDMAGEYDVKDVLIQGVESFHDDKGGAERGKNIIYRITMDDVVITHLGDLGHILDDKQLEELSGTDVLLIPVGGRFTLDAKKAVEVIAQIEPRIVIPMHYKTADSKIDVDGVDKFIKEIGLTPRMEDKLKVEKNKLPAEEMELVLLNV
jgi:L-ascorbate metabolism protein UlaG (beta-lactamase superfamily)